MTTAHKSVLITDGKALGKYITSTMKGYQSYGARVHIAVVSALAFAAVTGQNGFINTIYEGLRSNDQQAVKLFIRRASAINGMVLDGEDFTKATPDGQPAEYITAMVAKGSFLELSKGVFSVTRGHTSPEAQAFVKLLDLRLASPDGELDRAVLDRNNFAEVKNLGDAEALAGLLKALKAVDTDSDKTTVTVSDTIRAKFAEMRTMAENLAAQVGLAKA